MKTPAPPHPNILLVDDNQDGLLVRRTVLEELGYGVSIAKNGEEGLKLFDSASFDMVVTDYRMPGMNGAELIRRIRKLDPNARIILLSAFAETLGLTAENTGADVVIAKNSNEPAYLTRSVKRLLNRAARKPPASLKRSPALAKAASG